MARKFSFDELLAKLGGQALRFLGLLPEPPQKTDGNDGEEKEEAQGAAPGIETVKN